MSLAHAKADVDSGIYEARRKLLPGDKVLDLGAHVGFFTEVASARVGLSGRVIAVEPHADNYRALLERTKYRNNVWCVHAAAFSLNDLSALFTDPLNCGGHSCFPSDRHKGAIHCIRINIGVFLDQLRFRPDFVKIDTEGAEWEILQSLLFSFQWDAIPHFAIEIHSQELYWACRAKLENAQYDFWPLEPIVGVCYATKQT